MNVRELLSKNLSLLMKQQERISTQKKLSAVSKVSQTHIGNALRCDKAPTISIVESLALAAGLKTWQILVPTELLIRGFDERFHLLLESYLSCDEDGRNAILLAARGQAALKAQSAGRKS